MTPNLTRFWSTGCLECFWSLVYLWRCCNLSMGSAYHTEGLWADTKFGTGFGTETPRLQGRVQEVMRGRYGITIREDVTMAPWNTTRNADLKQVIISSPFLRCLQTAMVLAEHFDAETWLANNTRQRSLVEATISKEELDFKEHIYFNNLQLLYLQNIEFIFQDFWHSFLACHLGLLKSTRMCWWTTNWVRPWPQKSLSQNHPYLRVLGTRWGAQ